MNPGWVYILTNRSLKPDYLKIGYTTNDPASRASEISAATGVATPFDVAYSEAVPDCVEAESLVHKKLANFRINDNREFFHIDFVIAKNTMHEVCENVRSKSRFCRQCEAYHAKKELASIEKELHSYKTQLARINKTASFFALCHNYISRLLGAVENLFRRVLPSQYDRKVYIWVIFVPLGFTAWIILGFIFRDFAMILTLTVMLISAIMVIGSVRQEKHEQDE